MATAPGRGSSEGASPTASVTALLRVPGGTEVSGFGIPRVVDGGVTATGVLSRERGNLITISITLY